MDDKIIIDEEFIQMESESLLGRKLLITEYEDVFYTVMEGLSDLIQDKINGVIDFHKLLQRNDNAEKQFPYYEVYWRNEIAYQPEFKQIGVFKSEEDARQFVHYDIITEFDEWRVVLIDQDKTEQEVYKINPCPPDKNKKSE